MNLRSLFLVAVTSVAVASPATADVLWDQSTFDPLGASFFNSISGSPPFGRTHYTVSDITVPSPGWEVQAITCYFSAFSPSWGLGITQGRLSVFPKTGPLPANSNDPHVTPMIPMTATLSGNSFAVKASGLSIVLAPGEYWIGITPVAPSGFFGPENNVAATTQIGSVSATWDPFQNPPPPFWFNLHTDQDAAILVEGVNSGPVPTADLSWGKLKSFYR
jgi:hypothetical protein